MWWLGVAILSWMIATPIAIYFEKKENMNIPQSRKNWVKWFSIVFVILSFVFWVSLYL